MTVHSQDAKQLIIPTPKGNLILSLPIGLMLEEAQTYLDEFNSVFAKAIAAHKEKEAQEEQTDESTDTSQSDV